MSTNWSHRYSENEISQANSFAPAIERYQQIVSTETKKPKPSLYKALTLSRHQKWIECSLAQIFSKKSTQKICKLWSQSTLEIVKQAWESISGNEDLALFALGKLGAMELNLSSDIDILMVSHGPTTKEQFKFYKKFNEILSAHTELGFCYRLDYNLRPGGRLGPPISSSKEFENYYWTQGATWERIALHRLRPICGNPLVIDSVLETKKTFCYRKFLDFSVLEDIKNIRRHIQTEQNRDGGGVHLKLGVGGIRDIELYINSLQVIHGGKIPALQVTETSEALSLLKKFDLITKNDYAFLLKTYWHLRSLENLIQLKEDQQTHQLPTEFQLPNGNIVKTSELPFQQVDQIVSVLLGPTQARKSLIPQGLQEQNQWLRNKGFEEKIIKRLWPKIMSLTVYAKKNQRDEILRSRFLFHFIENVCQFGLDKNLSLNLLYEFIKSIRPKRSFYHLLELEPNIVKEIAILLSSSPYLGQMLASKPELLDSFLLRQFPIFSKDLQSLLAELSEYKQLNQILLSGQLLTHGNIERLTFVCSETADTVARKLLSSLKNSFPNNSLEIIKLGKWGGHDLGLLSDLDFIFVTQKNITDHDIKISRRFINMITNPQRGGQIYPVDLRLRPQSGSSTLICTKESLLKYLKTEAKIWERQSYLRALPLHLTSFRTDILKAVFYRPIQENDIAEMTKIKSQLFAENVKAKNPNNEFFFDLKFSPGGLIDIEFSCQIYFLKNNIEPISGNTLEMINQLLVDNSLENSFGETLFKNYQHLRYLEQVSQILTQHQTTYLQKDTDSFLRLSKHLNKSQDRLFDFIKNLMSENLKLLQQFTNNE